MDRLADIYDEGVRAYDEGKRANPYKAGTVEAGAWDSGWWDAEAVTQQGFTQTHREG